MATPIHPASSRRPTAAAGFAPDIVERLLDLALASPGKPPVFGIAGLQGSGKSTLARQLVAAGKSRGLAVVALSLDDFYLGKRERLALATTVHPLLATRGPPGTHDHALACGTLDALRRLPARSRQDEPFSSREKVPEGRMRENGPGAETVNAGLKLPLFDKLADRRLPPSRWPVVSQAPDLVVFEGWFLSVPPQAAQALTAPINELERDEDTDGRWRHYCNEALAHYAPLWCRIDRLLFLQGPGFDVVPAWRWQQEQALAKGRLAKSRKQSMSETDVARFVLFFERISRHAFATLPRLADHVLRLDSMRQPIE